MANIVESKILNMSHNRSDHHPLEFTINIKLIEEDYQR